MQTKAMTYREAVEHVRDVQHKAAELRMACDCEIELFDRALNSAMKLCHRLRNSHYYGDATCVSNRERDLKRNMTDFSAVQFSEDILAGVETAEQIILGQGSRYRSGSEVDEKDARLVNLCTYLWVLVRFFSNGDNYNRYKKWITDEYEQELGRMFDAASAEVASFVTRPPQVSRVKVPPVEETVRMPEVFPRTAPLPVGYYVAEDGDWVREASELLGEGNTELSYKKLLSRMAEGQCTTDALMPDPATSVAGNHLLIRQPHYHARELDDRPDHSDDRPLIELYETLTLRYLGLFPRISKRVCLIQPRDLSEIDSFVSSIYRRSSDLVLTVDGRDGRSLRASAADSLRLLLSECRAAKELLTAPWGHIAAYNADNYPRGIWKQMTLLLIKDYPVGFDDKAVECLESILQEGHKFGITVVMSVCDDKLAELTASERNAAYAEVLSNFDAQNVYTVHGYDLISRDSYRRVSFKDTTIRTDRFRMQTYLANLERYLANSRDPAIPLHTLFETSPEAVRERRENFSRVLDIPIGKSGTVDQHMKLYRTGGGSPHVVIAGTTGSGKSVLLQDIIISAACHYSPDELEMYLFDFKETPKGFERYRTGFPHVKKIATQCKERDILELLRMIRNTYTARMAPVSEAGFADIGGYNAHVRKTGGKPIPRMMVVIDEYQTITSEPCLNLLLEIAQKGREFGVSLVMASQSNKVTGFGNIIRLFGHRFEFKNEPLGELINHIGTRAQELNGPKGLCFYSSDGSGGLPVLLRCAYVNDEDKNEVIAAFTDTIRKSFGSRPESTYKVGSVTEIRRPVDFVSGRGRFLPLSAEADALRGAAKRYTMPFEGEVAEEAEWLAVARGKFQSPESISERGFLCRLGLNSISLLGVEQKIDRQNPYMMLCGNGDRLKAVEYSVMRSAVMASGGTNAKHTVVYYIDGDLQCDRRAPVYAMKGKTRAIRYADHSREGMEVVLAEIYAEYEYRRRCGSAREYDPVLVMLSSMDRLMELFGDAHAAPTASASARIHSRTPTPVSDADFDAKFAGMRAARGGGGDASTLGTRPTETTAPVAESGARRSYRPEKSGGELLEALLTQDMHKYDIFLCIRMGDPGQINAVKKKLREGSLSSILFLDRRSTHKGDRAEADRDETLAAMAAYAGGFLARRTGKMNRADIQTAYAYRLTGSDTLEFIPYEYDALTDAPV